MTTYIFIICHEYLIKAKYSLFQNYNGALFTAKCFIKMCLFKLFVYLVLCGQYGHWNCGCLPHSYFLWLCKLLAWRYFFWQVWHSYFFSPKEAYPVKNLINQKNNNIIYYNFSILCLIVHYHSRIYLIT